MIGPEAAQVRRECADCGLVDDLDYMVEVGGDAVCGQCFTEFYDGDLGWPEDTDMLDGDDPWEAA